MDYQETLAYLYSQLPMFHRIGPAAYKPSLKNTIDLCELLGNPERSFRSVHIAGTNGKGSTSHLIASALQEAGYKTGLYTSPHLKDFRERIKVNGQMIPQEDVVSFVSKYHEHWKTIQPSFFEMTVALCFWYFRECLVDIAVIETGLGGLLDSTNVITPEISVITNIGLDHTNLLGNTIEEIAIQKAGIIKEHVPVVLGEMRPEAAQVMLKYIEKNQCTLIDSVHEINIPPCPLQGNYQIENAKTATAALRALRSKNWMVREEDIAVGFLHVIENTGLMGRWQQIGSNPTIIADVAHNADGVKQVVQQAAKISFDQLHIVLGMVSDKDLDGVLSLFPERAFYYFCKADIPRGFNAEALKEKAGLFHLKGESYASVRMALDAAKNNASARDLILITGSFFTVAEII